MTRLIIIGSILLSGCTAGAMETVASAEGVEIPTEVERMDTQTPPPATESKKEESDKKEEKKIETPQEPSALQEATTKYKEHVEKQQIIIDYHKEQIQQVQDDIEELKELIKKKKEQEVVEDK
jgi:molecular chaperone GrpE (heat shock protein)